MEWLHNQCVFIDVDRFAGEKVKSIGFIAGLHPKLTHRETLSKFVTELICDTIADTDNNIKQEFCSLINAASSTTNLDVPIIQISSYHRVIPPSSDKSPKELANVFNVLVSKQSATLVKNVLMAANFHRISADCSFVPTGYTVTEPNAAAVIHSILINHRNLVNNIVPVAVYGLSNAAVSHPIHLDGVAMTFGAILVKKTEAYTLKPSSQVDEYGKWYLLAKNSAQATIVTDNFDSFIKAAYTTFIPQEPKFHVESFPHPRRSFHTAATSFMHSYAARMSTGHTTTTATLQGSSIPPTNRPRNRVPVKTVVWETSPDAVDNFPDSLPSRKRCHVTTDKKTYAKTASIATSETSTITAQQREIASLKTELSRQIKSLDERLNQLDAKLPVLMATHINAKLNNCLESLFEKFATRVIDSLSPRLAKLDCLFKSVPDSSPSPPSNLR
jgi:hypothetical protein